MEQLINFIIRPPRAEYDPKNDLLDQEFMLKGKWFQRKDVEVTNSRGDVLQCSHYMPIVCPEGKALPCVIYCHGNSGCRADASEAAIILLPSNITVFTLDFSGSGLSGGEHVTLGWNEKDDLRAVVDYLRADGNVSLIGLWGRSMGAVSSLMYGAEDLSIAGMVLDSPFSDLVDLMMELVDTYKVRLPKFTVKFAIQYMRRAILKKAKFDIMELNTIKVAKSCFVPVLLGHAVDDDFIQPHHSDRIFDAYVGDKNIIRFEGDHNSPRPQFYFDSINIFFHNVLQPPEGEVGGTYFDTTHDYFGKGSWSALNGVGYADDDFFTASIDPAASSTEVSINQLRSKRPMSRMEFCDVVRWQLGSLVNGMKMQVPSEISSKDKQSEAEEEGSGTRPVPSSSKMISFEFSNGHPCGPHVPTSIDEDEYVEYPLDNLADFPSNVEEEERMFMEAVIESLKDLDMRHPHTGEQPSSANTNPHEPLQKEKTAESPTIDNCASSTIESTTTLATNGHKLPFQIPSPDTTSSSTGPSPSTGASAHSDASTGSTSLASSDMVDCTKATVTVERNPSSNIIDGLMRRWDLNFFRNNR
ncbi:hypothetical protein TEA_027636 [Camellia sinensis var. sinensis]|uniref:Serine aminopeptidase S33 domain-containing protein n=1 Tax=Camellia sinensis var. sinensis TaxID=542762 RepID=A0A4S4EQM0_CAMSN|nr:hypothetical protein TEA_027636 [Camellia sinensis var. sinensis]